MVKGTVYERSRSASPRSSKPAYHSYRMDILSPVVAVISVLVAYYFGQKFRTRPLRSAVYSKQIDLAYELSQEIEEWGDEMRELHFEADSQIPIESKEAKGKLRMCQGEAVKIPGKAMGVVQRCEIILPSIVIDRLEGVVSVLMSRSMKILYLNIDSEQIDQASKEKDPIVEYPERTKEIMNTNIDEMRDEYLEACRSFRETCRDEFGIEALSDETKQAMKQLEETTLPKSSEELQR